MGLDLRVLSPTLFGMLVVMAIVTTIMTSPILHRRTSQGQLTVGRGVKAALPEG